MQHLRFPGGLIIVSLLFCHCTSSVTVSPVIVTMQEYAAQQCLDDSSCARIQLSFPVLSGGDSAVIRRLNDSIQIALYLVANADTAQPLKPALDSAAQALFDLLKGDYEAGSRVGDYTIQLESATPWQTGRFLSIQMDGYSYTGGAHGYAFTALNTFDLKTAGSVLLDDLVSDTLALRPLLEKAFLETHRQEVPDARLEDLLLFPDEPLAFPANYCVVPEGIRVVYNPYEVAPYAVGPTDFVLTWAQLGTLADRSKWLE